MHSVVVNITPAKAREMLSKSKGNPRFDNKNKLIESAVERYASDMKSGKWALTPQGISFNDKGELVDGHHRLNAVIRANKSVEMYVTFDVPSGSCLFDCCVVRTPTQIIQHGYGVSKELANSKTIAIAKLHKYFVRGENRAKMQATSNLEILEFLQKNELHIIQANKIQSRIFNGKKLLSNASFGHAAFCALSCGVPFDLVSEFSDIVQSGFVNHETKYAAVLARNELLSATRAFDQNWRAYQSKYIQTCLYDYVRGAKRVRKYKDPQAIYTEKMIESGRAEWL